MMINFENCFHLVNELKAPFTPNKQLETHPAFNLI